ncbi:MAG TPA: acyl-CoA dehydrogenase family protein [Acidimicrobiales bacterium]|nr:acyl-CoA dehydrogenase family protein [Acidimicrobiales bacterium]
MTAVDETTPTTPTTTTTTPTTTPTTPEGVLDAVRALAPTIAARAGEIEAARRVPPDLLDEVARAGAFRLLLPPSHGGLGADLPSALRVYEALARADASLAWTVMIGGGAWCDLAGLPRATFDDLFPGGDVVVAGAISPSGSIAPDDGGYRVSGRWGFASGCEHADVLYGNCIEGVVDGEPQLRIAVFSPDQVVIEDTWRVSGLCGTGSHHVRVDDVVVPAGRTVAVMTAEPCVDAPILRVPPPSLYALTIAAAALGTARAALDDVVALAAGKVPLFAAAPLATNPRFQFALATADTELRAARALVHETAGAAWETATRDDGPFTLEQSGLARAAAAWATDRAAAVVDAAYRAGGGTSLYTDSPLQRRLRDVHAITQHFLVKDDTLTTAGAVLLGLDPDVPVF